MIKETKILFNTFFITEEKKAINDIIKELKKENYCSDILWNFDKTIGGIGRILFAY
jgi:hypothetical protein